jgi:hypothetical protein
MGNLVEDFMASEEARKYLGDYSNPADCDDLATEIDAYAREERMSFKQARDILMRKTL